MSAGAQDNFNTQSIISTLARIEPWASLMSSKPVLDYSTHKSFYLSITYNWSTRAPSCVIAIKNKQAGGGGSVF